MGNKNLSSSFRVYSSNSSNCFKEDEQLQFKDAQDCLLTFALVKVNSHFATALEKYDHSRDFSLLLLQNSLQFAKLYVSPLKLLKCKQE